MPWLTLDAPGAHSRTAGDAVPRLFLSHSSRDNRHAIALRQWLIAHNPSLDGEIFLDLHRDDGIRAGVRWKDALRQASDRAEAVICLLSAHWIESAECRSEYRFAEYLNKRIFTVRIAAFTTDDPTMEWQQIDLCGDGEMTAVDIGDGGEPVSFSSDGLHRLQQGIIAAGIGAEYFAWPPSHDPSRAPYRGWEPLEEIDAAVFFGRDAQILRGLEALRGMRHAATQSLFVVLGPSGTGKSSFLRAGLLPRLRRDDREFVVLDIVRPQRNVLTGDTGLARAIHQSRGRIGLDHPPLGEIKNACRAGDVEALHGWLAELRAAATVRLMADGMQPPTVVLAVDQGEELFSTDAGGEAPAFLELVSRLTSPQAPEQDVAELIVAATIRTDRYVALQTAPALAAVQTLVFDELKPMPRTQFKEVITGPAERATRGGRPLVLEPALVNQLLDDCTEGADTLPLLALTMARLYDDYARTSTAPGSGDKTVTLRLADYESMGGMRSVVQTEINTMLSAAPRQRAEQLALLRSAFIPWLASFNPEDDQPVRRQARWTDLPTACHPLLDELVARRLLVKGERNGEVIVEVALESLLRQWDDLAVWLAEERDDLKAADILEQAALAWRTNNRDSAWLLGGSRLTEAENLAGKPAFRNRLASVDDFLGASRRREDERIEGERQQRESELLAAQQLAAAESAAREQAQAHATVLKKRSRILRAVLVVAVVVAIAAAAGFVTATRARHQADLRTREAVALRLTSQGQAMLAGVLGGGDVRAIQQILAAPRIASTGDVGAEFNALVERWNTLKIIATPAPVHAVALSPDGHRIASAGFDHLIRLWDIDTGQLIGKPLSGHTDVVTSVAFSPDGHRLASASYDHDVRLWNADTGQPIGAALVGHTASVHSVAFSPDGHRLVSGSSDKTVRMWNADSGQPIRTLNGHTDWVDSVAFSPDGHRIVSGSDDHTVRLWDADTGQPVRQLDGHTDWVVSVAFSPDGHRIASASNDLTVRIWNADTGQQIGDPLVGHTGAPASVVFSADGRRIISGGQDDTLRMWDATTGLSLGDPLVGHTSWVTSVAAEGAGERVVSGSNDGTVRVWSTAIAKLTGHSGPVNAVAFSPDGRRAVSGSEDATLRRWDLGTGQQIGTPLTGHTKAVSSVAFSPDGHRIASAGKDGTVRLWDADTGRPIGAPLAGHNGIVTSVAFSPDGHRLVSAGYDKTLILWNADTGQPIGAPLVGHTDVVTSAAFSPDGHTIVSGSYDKTVMLWDADTGRPRREPLHGHSYSVRAVAFSPDGHRIASGSQDDTVRLWDAGTGQPASAPLVGHTGTVQAVAFSPDGHTLVSGSDDTTLRLWDVDTAAPIGQPLTGDTAAVQSVAFSSDGSRMVSGSDDRSLRLWPDSPMSTWLKLLCDKLSANMSTKDWRTWVSPAIDYLKVCPNLPVAR